MTGTSCLSPSLGADSDVQRPFGHSGAGDDDCLETEEDSMTSWEKAIAHVGIADEQYRHLLRKAKTDPATEEQKDAFGRLWSTLEGRTPPEHCRRALIAGGTRPQNSVAVLCQGSQRAEKSRLRQIMGARDAAPPDGALTVVSIEWPQEQDHSLTSSTTDNRDTVANAILDIPGGQIRKNDLNKRRITTVLPKANATAALLSDGQLEVLRDLAKDAEVGMNRHGLLDNKGGSRAASASVSVSVSLAESE